MWSPRVVKVMGNPAQVNARSPAKGSSESSIRIWGSRGRASSEPARLAGTLRASPLSPWVPSSMDHPDTATSRLQARTWEGQDGHKRKTTEIIVNDFEFLDSRQVEAVPNGSPPAESVSDEDILF
jgi:hypothetical protein